MVLFPEKFRLQKSLQQVINKGVFELRIDTVFSEVIRQCSKIDRPDQYETWITNEMIKGYTDLHKLGYAHSFESFHKGELVGGLYGISVGNCFFGESMFYRQTNASKVAFYHLVQFAIKQKFAFIDAQQETDHLKRLGAETVSRDVFLDMLEKALQNKTLQGKWTNY
jgi:leucyl/phenylalanyl-tRNA--protein transferase